MLAVSSLSFMKGDPMKKTKEYHVTKRPDGNWQYKEIHNTRATGVTATQTKAFEAARAVAIKQRAEVVIHGENGRIREKNSYGNDPFPPKG